MPYLHQPGSSDEIAQGGKIEEAAVAVAADAYFVVPSWVGAEQDAPGLQGFGEFCWASVGLPVPEPNLR